jgi:hypothetical protein
MRRIACGAGLALVAALLTPPLAAQVQRSWAGRLSPVPIGTGQAATITGVGSVKGTLTGSRLVISGEFRGLQTAATVARLHRGPKGIRGPAIFDLTVTPATSGSISGTLDLNPTQIDDLGRERFYVQIHSEKAPDGNLWGWLLVQENR